MSKKPSEEEVLLKLSKDYDIPIESLQKELEEKILAAKQDPRYVNAKESEIRDIARNLLTTSKRREFSSPAINWKGIVLGVGDLIDTVAKIRRLSIESYNLDPVKTSKGCMYKEVYVIAKTADVPNKDTGQVETKVIPLYPKTENNDKFKRSLTAIPEHSWLRTIIGVAAPIDKKTKEMGVPRIFTMSLNGKLAIEGSKIPSMKPVNFKGIDKTDAETAKINEYKINGSSYTIFEEDSTLELPPIEDILTTDCAKKLVQLGDLDQWHNDHEKDNSRWCITIGTVLSLDLEPNQKTGNMRMTLDDESLMFAPNRDEKSIGILCWIPSDRKIDLEFSQDSRVYAIGRSGRGKAYDRETRQVLDTPGDVQLNVYGIYIPNIYRVQPDEEPVTEEAFIPPKEPLEIVQPEEPEEEDDEGKPDPWK